MTQSPPSANRQIAQAAGIVMAAFALANITGLIRQILVSGAFGTGSEIDAYNAAARIPELLFSLVAGGALASAFVPTLTGFLTRDDRQGAWFLSSAILNLVTAILIVASAVGILLAPQLVQNLLAPGFSPPQQALSTALLRILLLTPAIFGVSALAMGVLNAHQKFLLPALAPTMYWLGMIFGVLFLAPGWGIFGLAWGAVLGALMHLGIQIPGLRRLPGRRYSLSFGLKFPAVREVGRLMGPRILGAAAVQINFLVNTIIASGQPQGSLTAITLAWAVMTMPQVVIGQAIAIASLPTFSAQVALNKLNEMRSSLAATLRATILLSLPASVGLILLGRPIVSLLFERGRFDDQSTEMVYWALIWFSAGLVAHGVVEITSRAFYAQHDTKTPVLIGVGAMALNIGLSLALSAWFQELGLPPHGGLALANSVATTLEMGALLLLMRRRLDGLEGRAILGGTAQAAVASLVMGLALWLWISRVPSDLVALVSIGGVVVGAAVYGLVVLALGAPEARQLVQYGGNRLRGN
ncbi:MAG: murein biosynthesis integral membrane protein MurJ [Anaerolineales bacterium]|nr:murein biosynthesis integral membrane protein MurJ [Anaerolineales bacterium]